MTQDPQGSAWDAPHHDQQPVEPSAAPQQGYGQQGYGQPPAYGPPTGYAGVPAHGQGYAGGPPAVPGYAGDPAGAAPPVPTSAVVLLVLSGLVTLAVYWTVVGLVYVAPVVLGILALTRNRTDPAGARRFARNGWIVFAAITVLFVLLVVAAVVGLVALSSSSSGGYDGSSI